MSEHELTITCPTCGGGKVRYACHHCGRLLCEKCHLEIPDSLFLGDNDKPVEAFHCKPCAKSEHGYNPDAKWRKRWSELRQMKRDIQANGFFKRNSTSRT